MNQLLAMRAFCCIVEAKGFSAAAERLDTTHSTVSRQLQQLEVELGVQLINRNTRRFSLTRAGEQYYASCVDILQRVDVAAQAMAGEHQRPAGLLRVSVPQVIGTLELGRWLPGFQQRFPDIELELSCDDQFIDLVAERFDVALRIAGPLADTTLVARTLAISDMMLVASAGYVRASGLPRTVKALEGHQLLGYSGRGGALSEWQLSTARGATVSMTPKGRLRSDTISGLYAATLAGAGISAFTQATVQADLDRGLLVRILPQYTLGTRHYYALYPQSKHLAPKVRAFVDFMAEYYQSIT